MREITVLRLDPRLMREIMAVIGRQSPSRYKGSVHENEFLSMDMNT